MCLVQCEGSNEFCTVQRQSQVSILHSMSGLVVMFTFCCFGDNGKQLHKHINSKQAFTYGLADGNMREACCLYQEWFPGHRISEQIMLIMIHQCFRDSGAFVVN